MSLSIPPSAASVQREIKVYTPYQYGAKGDGTTDDTAAFIAMKTAVEASVGASSIYEGRYQAEINLGVGKFVVTGSAEIFPGAGSPRPWGLVIRGVSEDATQILWAPTGTEPCLQRSLAANGAVRCRRYNFSIICTNAHARCAGFISTADGGGGPQSDLYENLVFHELAHAIIADGTNLNSERSVKKCTVSGNNNIVAFWERGLPTGQTGGDQFVNNWFDDLSFTCGTGTVTAARYGGGYVFKGGNFIHTGINAGTACGSPVYLNAQCASGGTPQLRVPSGSYTVQSGMILSYSQTGQTLTCNATSTITSAANTAQSAIATGTATAMMCDKAIGHVAPVIQVAAVPTIGATTISLKISAGGTTHTLVRGDMFKVQGDTETNYWVTANATLDTTGISVSITPPIGATTVAINTAVECLSAAYFVLQNEVHAAGTQHLTIIGARCEHRTRDSRFIDSEWGGGAIEVYNSPDTVNAFSVGPFASSTFRFGNSGGPSIKWTGGGIHGGHMYCYKINGWQVRNSIQYEGVNWSHTAEPAANLWTYAGEGINRNTHGNPGGAPAILVTRNRGTATTDQHVGTFWSNQQNIQHRQFDAPTVRCYFNGVYGSLGASDSVTIVLPRNQVVTRIFGWLPASSGVTGTSPTWTLTNGNAVTLATSAPATSAAGFVTDIATPYETGTEINTRTLTLTSNANVVGTTGRWRYFVEF